MTTPLRNLIFGAMLVATLPIAALAADPATNPADQLAGLFVQSCVHFAGERDALRHWADQIGLQRVVQQAEASFLNGQPGMVFDASNTSGKYVLISANDGACSAMTPAAAGPAVIAALEQYLAKAGITATLTSDKTDPQEAALQHRVYSASSGSRQVNVLVSTVTGTADGAAMLTVTP